jgi:hypothetical protein
LGGAGATFDGLVFFFGGFGAAVLAGGVGAARLADGAGAGAGGVRWDGVVAAGVTVGGVGAVSALLAESSFGPDGTTTAATVGIEVGAGVRDAVGVVGDALGGADGLVARRGSWRRGIVVGEGACTDRVAVGGADWCVATTWFDEMVCAGALCAGGAGVAAMACGVRVATPATVTALSVTVAWAVMLAPSAAGACPMNGRPAIHALGPINTISRRAGTSTSARTTVGSNWVPAHLTSSFNARSLRTGRL